MSTLRLGIFDIEFFDVGRGMRSPSASVYSYWSGNFGFVPDVSNAVALFILPELFLLQTVLSHRITERQKGDTG